MNLSLFHSKAKQTFLSQFHKLPLVYFLSTKTQQPPPLQLRISPKVLILAVYFVDILLRFCCTHWKHDVKYFLKSLMQSVILIKLFPKYISIIRRSVWVLLKFCCTHWKHDVKYFLKSLMQSVILIKLFQKYISIIRRSIWVAISSTLPPVQAWSRKIETSIASISPVHLTTVGWSLVIVQQVSQWVFVCCKSCYEMFFWLISLNIFQVLPTCWVQWSISSVFSCARDILFKEQ